MSEKQAGSEMISVDARGFSCPIPVVKTQQAIERNPASPVTVLVDSEAARDNVSRLARSRGYTVVVEGAKGEYCLLLSLPVKA
jgi:tRNA 2-thiouridine synthesizing protein A